MKEDIREKVRLQRINVQSLSAVKNNLGDRKGSFDIQIKLAQEIIEDDDNGAKISFNITVGNEKQPFTIDLDMHAYFRKLQESVSGQDILDNIQSLYFPILSEASLVLAQVVSYMNYPPLIISPQEFLLYQKEAQNTETNSNMS
ncbi:MAG TPA: hypothetical protein PLP71_04860 [Syntrophomonadaceae bacterium]|nr:hypothetical protein [Syntrophomonadaceae bacterium]HQD90335.1 hypothetical protein [Syntrophomonadaceae bacterium]